MKTNKNNLAIEKALLFGIFLILVLPLVSAIGVGSLYTGSESPLKLIPEEEKIVALELQNWDGVEELTLEGEILKGMDIAKLTDSKINVPYQEKIITNMVVKAPADAKIGDVYNIEYIFRQVPGENNGGMVSFTQSITRNFDVVIVSEEVIEPGQPVATTSTISNTTITLLVVGVVLVIIIIWFLVKKKK
jgi:hypothetical protein